MGSSPPMVIGAVKHSGALPLAHEESRALSTATTRTALCTDIKISIATGACKHMIKRPGLKVRRKQANRPATRANLLPCQGILYFIRRSKNQQRWAAPPIAARRISRDHPPSLRLEPGCSAALITLEVDLCFDSALTWSSFFPFEKISLTYATTFCNSIISSILSLPQESANTFAGGV